jgi:betaine-aldehyde dehydrogenase
VRVHDGFFIGGDWSAPAGRETVDVISPSTEEPIGRIPRATNEDIDAAVMAARRACDEGAWPRTSPSERAEAMRTLSDALKARHDDFAAVFTDEVGSPSLFSQLGQTLAALMILDYYVELADDFAFQEVRDGVMGRSLVVREPVGVAGCILPWNAPLYVTMLKLAPALLSGSTVVLKPPPNTPLFSYLLAQAIQDTGLPPGVVNIVPADRQEGEHLVTHPLVDKISFTGSTRAGRRVAALCGEQIKRASLELGGKSAAIILDDADLEQAIPALLPAAIMNNGEACVAQTRILASQDRHDEVVDRLTEAVSAWKVGDPHDDDTMVGPLVSAVQRERVEGYIATGRDQGAKLALGGGRPAHLDRGWYVEPTVFVDVDNKMTIAQEEIFGPVLSVIPYGDEAEAIAIANDSAYGLSGSVYAADPDRAVEVARQVRAGTLTVNGFTLNMCAPFGGFKQSGLGRELGPEALDAYLEPKSINVPADYQP